ncbi:hypothetical protein GTW56_28110 [Bacillus sp. EB93]|nr:hypothetical protein [Peribacillus frigoritolerans]
MEFDSELILAAEDFPDEEFRNNHTFSIYENKIIRKLIAHGPVLIRGGRGCGKSALMKEAFFRTTDPENRDNILGVYLSLRYLPLLRSEGKDYENFFCRLVIDNVNQSLTEVDNNFAPEPEIGSLQQELFNLSRRIKKRIVLFFDDAAHIGRETSLKEFFDIFRTLSSNTISCKAAIYPGVTEFGSRFDILNDANVIDIARNEEAPSFGPFFKNIIELRFSSKINNSSLKKITLDEFSHFMGRAVTGNVRAFVFALNHLLEISDDDLYGIREIDNTLKYLATEYYWPLLEELEPKLGKYEPLINPTRELAEILYKDVSESIDKPGYGPSFLIHRDSIERLKKLFEIMEYVGFLVKRDSSRAMKNGGRGARYILNLCNLIDVMPGNRLSHDLFNKWNSIEKEYIQIYRRGILDKISLPSHEAESESLGILSKPVTILSISKVYPYGLTSYRIQKLTDSGFETVGSIAEASNEELLKINDIGEHWLRRIRSVVGQAIWM